MSILVDVIINYYNPDRRDDLYYQTLRCISCYKLTGDNNIILSDGSAFKDERLVRLSKDIGFVYLWSERNLSFGEGYNEGIDYSLSNSSADYICLSANDIFVSSDSICKMLRVIRSNDTIGCVIPYLSSSALLNQRACYLKRLRYPLGMTLNVNLFRKEDLVRIGKVPKFLGGNFNDLVMFAQLRGVGKKIIICDGGNIIHLGGSTIRVTKSTASCFSSDKQKFIDRYPDLAPKNPHLDIRYSAFSQTYSSLISSHILDNCNSFYLTQAWLRLQPVFLTFEKIIFEIIRFFYRFVYFISRHMLRAIKSLYMRLLK